MLSNKNESNSITQARLSTCLTLVRFKTRVSRNGFLNDTHCWCWCLFGIIVCFYYSPLFSFYNILFHFFSFLNTIPENPSCFTYKLHQHTVYLFFQDMNETQFNWQNHSWLSANSRGKIEKSLHWNVQLSDNIDIHLKLPCLIHGTHYILLVSYFFLLVCSLTYLYFFGLWILNYTGALTFLINVEKK